MKNILVSLLPLILVGCLSTNRGAFHGENLWRVQINDRFGFINKTGSIVISPEFKIAGSFNEGLAFVKLQDGQTGYIKPDGSVAFTFLNENSDSSQHYSEGLAAVRRKGLNGYIDQAGAIAIAPRYDSTFRFSEGRASAKLDGGWGVIDRSGEWIIQPSYRFINPYSQGLAFAITQDKKCGFLDAEGHIAIPFRFRSASDFSYGLAIVSDEKGIHYIDKSGKLIYSIPDFLKATPFSESGLAAVQDIRTSKWGFIDTSFEVKIPLKYDDCKWFSEGLAAVKVGEQWGYINEEGLMIISPRFAECMSFENDLARVNFQEADGMWRGEGAIIDKKGRVVWPKKL